VLRLDTWPCRSLVLQMSCLAVADQLRLLLLQLLRQ
jgi:hypothetical protein